MESISPHLSFEKITGLAVGDAPDAEMAEHLKSCTQCEFELAQTARLVGLMREDATEDAPPFAIAAILRSFDEYRAGERVSPERSVGQRLRAILRLDSAHSQPAYGFRSAGAANSSRQLLFYAGEGTLDLRITATEAHWIISGQVLGEMCDGKIELRGDSVNLETEFDSECQFTLPPISPGTYRLRLYSENFDVEIPELIVG